MSEELIMSPANHRRERNGADPFITTLGIVHMRQVAPSPPAQQFRISVVLMSEDRVGICLKN